MIQVFSTEFEDIKLARRGKVRDVYDLGDSLLIIASDRISAFDVIMDDSVPAKGKILSQISLYWFEQTKSIIDNHLISVQVDEYPDVCHKYRAQLEGRSMLVKKCRPLPVEFIARGYVAGSGWKEYQKFGTICGVPCPEGLQEFEKLPEPIFTPSAKADVGHDENISFEKTIEILGKDTAEYLKNITINLYKFAADLLEKNGIILADTKFEFGEIDGKLILIDEALTPDSSRFWLKKDYAPAKEQTNFDKQILRDYLETLDWNKQAPPPKLPIEIIEGTLSKYKQAFKLVTGKDFID